LAFIDPEEQRMGNQWKVPAEPTSLQTGHVIERPDGFYWQDKHSEAERGPFSTLREAEEDMAFGPAEEDASIPFEDEDTSDWVDPETGEAAGHSFSNIDDL
jgi:hypothetical protein